MDHLELIQELSTMERMSAQDRLKQAKKRRHQQLKKWAQYEKQIEKDNSKKPKKKGVAQQSSVKKPKRAGSDRVQFAPNIALLESAARNDIEEVRRLLQQNVNPDVTNEDGLTALHQCCIDDNEEMLKTLLDYKANVNACDSELWTPLHAAATCGHVTLCKLLIDRGADLLAVNADGNMPYDICEDEVTLDYIESEMAKRGITQEQIDNTRLTTERHMLDDLKEHAAKGGDLEFKDASGATMLHIAAANGYVEVADFLLDHHVNVDARDNESWQPIHAASYWSQLDILEMLVQNGADLDSKTKNGEAPFDLTEDPDIKQKILDLKDEIETNRLSRQRPGSTRKVRHNSRNASMRRSSLRGEKSNLFKKEAQEEAMHFGLRLLQDEDLSILDEEKENNVPATNLDDVTISFDDENPKKSSVNAVQTLISSNKSEQVSVQVAQTNNNTVQVQGGQQGNNNKPIPPAIIPRGSSNPNKPLPGGGSNVSSLNDESFKDPKKESIDDQLQKMFLETVPQIIDHSSAPRPTQNQNTTHIHQPPMTEKVKNGHNNSNSTTISFSSSHNSNTIQSSFRDGQLKRFVAPPSAPVVGSENDDKQRCCVIL